MMEANHLKKSYGGRTVLDDVSFSLRPGTMTGLLAPNGAGKTTLLKILAGLALPDEGSTGTKKGELSYLPEQSALDESLTPAQLADLYAGFFPDFQKETALQLLDQLDIPKDQKLKTLSKGTVEKVQLILAMARKARIYLLDEPLSGSDPAARQRILQIILNSCDPESIILLSTHLISDVEQILDDVLFLKDGKVLLHENADELRRREGESIDAIFRRIYQ